MRDQRYRWGGFAKEGWDESNLFQVNADGSGLTQQTFEKCHAIVNPQWAGNGKTIVLGAFPVTVSGQSEPPWPLGVYSVGSYSLGTTLTSGTQLKGQYSEGVLHTAASPHSNQVAIISHGGELHLLTIGASHKRLVITPKLACDKVAFGKDKQVFVLTGNDGLWQIDANGKNLHQIVAEQLLDDLT